MSTQTLAQILSGDESELAMSKRVKPEYIHQEYQSIKILNPVVAFLQRVIGIGSILHTGFRAGHDGQDAMQISACLLASRGRCQLRTSCANAALKNVDMEASEQKG